MGGREGRKGGNQGEGGRCIEYNEITRMEQKPVGESRVKGC